MDYLEHVTLPGDRLDLISARYYGGDPFQGPAIMQANPGLVTGVRGILEPVLDGGILIRVPIPEEPAPEDLTSIAFQPWTS